MTETVQIFVKPVAGRLVLLPGTRTPLDAAGALVERSPFWVRRIGDGDAIEATPKPTKSAKSKE